MIHRVCFIGKTVVDFIIGFENDYDEEGVLACFRDAGASSSYLSSLKALDSSCGKEGQITFVNKNKTRAVVLLTNVRPYTKVYSLLSREVRDVVTKTK